MERGIESPSPIPHNFRSKEIDLVKSGEYYPYSASPIISPPHGIRFGDIICEGAGRSKKYSDATNLDELSYAILYANNIFMKLRAIMVATELERRFRRHHLVYEKAMMDRTLQQNFAYITGRPIAPNDPNHPIMAAVRTTLALYRLFQDNFPQQDFFEGDVQRLDLEREGLSTVLKAWIRQEEKFGV